MTDIANRVGRVGVTMMADGLGGHSTAPWSAQAECSLLHRRIERQADDLRILTARIDAIATPLPASSVPQDAPEPIQAPETPEALATRLLADPGLFAGVLRHVARHGYTEGRQQLHDEIRSQEAKYSSNAAGLRLLAATIASGSFGK